jgi:hypothetical protein
MARHKHQQEVFELLRRMSGLRTTLAIPRILVRLAGGYEEAAMLSQILYWSKPNGEDPGWFYKSRGEWAEELELTVKQIRRARTNLESRGLIQTKVRRLNNSPITWYAPNPEGIAEALEKHLPKRAGDWPIGAAAAAQEGQSSITLDYSQDSVEFTPEEKTEALLKAGRDQGLPEELISQIIGDIKEWL